MSELKFAVRQLLKNPGFTTIAVLTLALGSGANTALFKKLVFLGAGFGLVLALALTRILQSMLYSIEPTDPITLAGATLLLVAVELLACWLPARRAASIHPMEALHYE